MKLKKEFIYQELGNDSFLVSTVAADFSGLMRGNKTFGAILELLKEETTKTKVIMEMCDRFDASEEVIAKDVEKTLEMLRTIGALDE